MTRPVPVTRPRGAAAFLLPLPVGLAAGLGAGLDPHTTLVVAAAVASALVLGVRLEWAALAVVATAVFEAYLELVSPWATEWLSAVLVVAWLVRRAGGRLHDHRLGVAGVPSALLLAAVAVSSVAHPQGFPGLVVSARYAVLVVVLLVLADTLCGPLAPRRAARVYVLACVAASVCGLATAAVTERRQVVGPVDSADTLAFFLVAAVPLVGTVRTRPGQSTARVWWCLGVLVAAGIGTQSRPALAALVAMTALAVATGLLGLRYAGALLAVVTTGAALVIALSPSAVEQAITDPERYSGATVSERNDVRLAAWRMTESSPLVGLGPAAFALQHDEHLAREADSATHDTAYSTVLEAAAELGLLGLLALYAVWLSPAVGLRERWRRRGSQLSATVLVALVGLVAASVVESQQHALPLWLVAALAVPLGRRPPPRTPLLPPGLDRKTSGQVGPRS